MIEKLPPYGKTLFELQKSHQLPLNDVYLFVGHYAWYKAKSFQISRPTTLCLPPYLSPFTYVWPVQKCDMLLFDTGNCDENYIEDIVLSLLRYDANIVRYISPDYLLTIFKKDF